MKYEHAAFPDQPIQTAADDRLGRTDFSRYLAAALLGLRFEDSLVVGLYGPWGCGKTSILNMALSEVVQDSQTIVFRFNPWNFSGQAELAQAFFQELSAAIGKKAQGHAAEQIGRWLKAYARALDLFSYVPPAAPVTTVLSKVLNSAAEAAEKWGTVEQEDLESTRTALESGLRSLKQRILIVIDDIDRLTDLEICEIFKLVKTVANFPNTIYLLAFDRDVVETALNKVQHERGSEYLEKIVELPFQVPAPSRSSIHDELFRMMNEVLVDVPAQRFDRERWQNLFLGGISHFVGTLRDAKRYANGIAFANAIIGENVNVVDLAALEAIRIFAPCMFQGIASNRDLFLGLSQSNAGANIPFFQKLANKLGSAESSARVCFPDWKRRSEAQALLGGGRQRPTRSENPNSVISYRWKHIRQPYRRGCRTYWARARSPPCWSASPIT